MYYDDEARRFNFVSGLVLGAVLGAGLALVLAPQERVRPAQPLLRSSGLWKKRANVRRGHRMGAVGEALAQRWAAARELSNR